MSRRLHYPLGTDGHFFYLTPSTVTSSISSTNSSPPPYSPNYYTRFPVVNGPDVLQRSMLLNQIGGSSVLNFTSISFRAGSDFYISFYSWLCGEEGRWKLTISFHNVFAFGAGNGTSPSFVTHFTLVSISFCLIWLTLPFFVSCTVGRGLVYDRVYHQVII